ncbi:MAG: hypothetical protein QNJ07_05560 [Woeseiaceae bacterium]|nr:hypothetical protein [Woeseiaceae bacterium]
MRALALPVAAILSLAGGVVAAQQSQLPDPFFRDDSLVTATLTAPMAFVLEDRSVEEQAPGTLAVDGEIYEVQVRARGRFRRDPKICDFPPIRLNFRKSETRDTALHGLDKVKVVTHCKTGSSRYEQGVVREYLAYRILNHLTDLSFNARLLRITYHDSNEEQDDITSFAIILEHREQFEKRTGKARVKIQRTEPSSLDAAHTNLVSVFQYMIGNTDYSPVAVMEGETCCHNSDLFGGEGQPMVSIPYDFDMAGLVSAPHAAPNPRFRLESVRERLYRGRCINNDLLPGTLAHFVAHQAAILEMIETIDGPSAGTRTRAARYVKDFYKTVSKPKLIKRRMADACI